MGTKSEGFIDDCQNTLEPGLKAHLTKVYTALSWTIGFAALGAIFEMYTNLSTPGFLIMLGSFIFLLLLIVTADEEGKNNDLRFFFLMGFGFFNGLGLGPLLNYATEVQPMLIFEAVLSTFLVFVGFTLMALMAERGYWLFLGGPLCAILLVFFGLNLLNYLLQSELLFCVQLYGGLLLLCAFIIFDTTIIMEKYRDGSKDYITHSVMLFADVFGIFVRILIILLRNNDQERRRREN